MHHNGSRIRETYSNKGLGHFLAQHKTKLKDIATSLKVKNEKFKQKSLHRGSGAMFHSYTINVDSFEFIRG